MLSILKEKDALLTPLAKALPMWLTPNMLSLVRFVFIPIVVALTLAGYPELAVLVFLFGFFLDALDGTMARVRNQHSELGAVLDPLADKGLFLVTLLIIGITTLPFNLIFILLLLDVILVAGTAVFANVLKGTFIKRDLGANIYGKLKTFTQIIAILILGFSQNFDFGIAVATVLLWLSVLLHVASVGKHIFIKQNTD